MAVKMLPAIKTGSLRVWWIPQIPGKPFTVDVQSVVEAKLLLDALANYDEFQLKHRIKPDYSNTGGLNVWEGTEWIDWYSDEGEDIDAYELSDLRKHTPKWEGAK